MNTGVFRDCSIRGGAEANAASEVDFVSESDIRATIERGRFASIRNRMRFYAAGRR